MPGLMQNLMDFYRALEDRYYELMDKVDALVPVYKVIDSIDRFIPSFLLFIALIVLLVGGLVYLMPPGFAPWIGPVTGEADLTIKVKSVKGEVLADAGIELVYGGQRLSKKTDDKGSLSQRIPIGQTVAVTVVVEGFEKQQQQLLIQTGVNKLSFALKELIPETKKTIYLKDQLGNLITDADIELSFSCTNAEVTPPAKQKNIDGDGIFEVIVPGNCGRLVVSWKSNAFKNSFAGLEEEFNTLKLSAVDEGIQGTVSVIVSNDSTDLGGLQISLFDSLGSLIDIAQSNEFGETTFSDVMPGSYYVVVSDQLGRYGSVTSDEKTLEKNSSISFDVQVEKNIVGSLVVKAVDLNTGQAMDGVQVVLKKDNKEACRKTITDAAAGVACAVTELGSYKVEAVKQDYLPVEVTKNVDGNNVQLTVSMDRVTESNSGKIKVQVVDVTKPEQPRKVSGAKVMLYEIIEATGEEDLKTIYGTKITDANGVVFFEGIKEGVYYAYAEKYPGVGKSVSKQLRKGAVTELPVELKLGEAVIEFDLKNEDLQQLTNATITLKNGSNEVIRQEAYPTADNKNQFKVRLGQDVYALIEANGYYSIQTEFLPLVKDRTAKIERIMKRLPSTALTPLEENTPIIEFKGFYADKASDSELAGLQPNSKYIARFSLRLNKDFDKAGFHLRAGLGENAVNDFIALNALNELSVPGTSIEASSTAFTGNYTFDAVSSAAEAQGLTKWASYLLDQPKKGIYEIEVEVKVKPQVPKDSFSVMYFKAFSQTGTPTQSFLEPQDARIQTNKALSLRERLYAKDKVSKPYLIGVTETCDKAKGICFREQLIETPFENPLILPKESGSYETALNQVYEYDFNIVNIGASALENVSLKILGVNTATSTTLGDSVEFNAYTLINSDGNEFSDQNLIVKDLNTFTKLGAFKPTQSITGSLVIKPLKPSSFVLIRIEKPLTGVIWSQVLKLQSITAIDMVLSVSPEKIFAYTTTRLEATVKKDELALAQAMIRVYKKESAEGIKNRVEPFPLYSGNDGKAGINLSAGLLTANSIIVVEAQKPGFKQASIEKPVSQDYLLAVDPETDATIDPEAGIQASISSIADEKIFKEESAFGALLALKNQSGQAFTVTKAEFVGDITTSPYLNISQMQNYINPASGFYLTTITAKETAQETLVFPIKVALTEQAKQLLRQTTLTGILYIKAVNNTFNLVEEIVVPFTLRITLPSGVDRRDCLVLGMADWIAVTEPNRTITKTFTLTNACEVVDEETGASEAVDLENVSVSLTERPGARIGISLTKQGTNETFNSNLVGYNTLLIPVMPKDSIFTGIISFIPTDDFGINTFDDDLQFTARHRISTGQTEPVSSDEKTLELKVIDLRDCIHLSSEELRIAGSSWNDSALVDITNDCGEDARIRVCSDDDFTGECSNRGLLPPLPQIVRLSFSPTAFRYLDQDGRREGIELGKNLPKTITVYRNNVRTGLYALKIEAKIALGDWKDVGIVNLLAEKFGSEYFSVGPYDGVYAFKGDVGDAKFLNEGYVGRRAEGLVKDATISNYSSTNDTINGKVNIPPQIALSDPLLQSLGKLNVPLNRIDLSGDREYKIAYRASGTWKANHGSEVPITISCPEGYGVYDSSNYEIMHYECKDKCDNPTFSYAADNSSITITHVCHGWHSDAWYRKRKNHKSCLNFHTLVFCEKKDFHDKEMDRTVGIPLQFPNHNVASAATQFRDIYLNSTGNKKEYKHVGFITQPSYELPKLGDTVFACKAVGKSGVTGPGAKPRVKYNWNWSGVAEGGIDWNSCDASNPNAVYCDMSQFTISHLERLSKLKAFFEENNSVLVCPQATWDVLTNTHVLLENGLTSSPETLEEGEFDGGSIGIEGINYQFSPPASVGSSENSLQINVAVANRLTPDMLFNDPVPLNVEVKLLHPSQSTGYYDSTTSTCSTLSSQLLAKEHIEVLSCKFDDVLEYGDYGLQVKLVNPYLPSGYDDAEDLYSTQSLEGYYYSGIRIANSCPVLFTETSLSSFIPPANAEGKNCTLWGCINWNGKDLGFEDISNVEQLRKLLSYDALLMRDSFSEDFRNDFDEKYRPLGEGDALGGVPRDYWNKDKGLWKLFTQPSKFIVKKFGSLDPRLSVAGEYAIETSINFEAKNWLLISPKPPLFPPSAVITTVFTLTKPEHSNELYYLPFDGEVGLNAGAGNKMDRQGYGMGFESGSEEIKDVIPWTDADGTNPLIRIKGKNVITYSELNSAENKGNLLRVSNLDETKLRKQLTLSPSIATPVLMKISANWTTEPVEVYYSLLQIGEPKPVGDHLASWSGIGNSCLDFQENYVKTKFTPDIWDSRKGESQNTYKMMWDRSKFDGDEYLKTIMYTPKDTQMALKSQGKLNASDVKFIGPNEWTGSPENWVKADQVRDQVSLSGTVLESMKADTSSIESILNLMDRNFVCMSYSSGGTELWWNPKKINEQEKGAGQSIKAFEDKLNITSPSEIIPCIRS